MLQRGLSNFDLREEHLDIMRQILPAHARLEFLSQVPAAHLADVTCAYQSNCP